MDFIDELKKDLIEYEKIYTEIKVNRVFTNEEALFIYNEITTLRELIEIIKENQKV